MGVVKKRQPRSAKKQHHDEDTIVVTPKIKSKKHPIPPRTGIEKRRSLVSKAPQLANHILMIFVGQSAELVTVHSNLLPDATQAHINQVCAGLPTYQLPGEDPEIFHIYRSWLYDKKLYTIADGDRELERAGRMSVHKDGEWTRIAHCYLLGVTLKDERFANAALSGMVEKTIAADRYPTGIASDVYAHTSSGDKLRKLIVDFHVWKGLGGWIKAPHDDSNGPVEFIRDVVTSMADAGGHIYREDCEAPWAQDLCGVYHLHEASEKCKA
ncbi:uncharacterized protein LTR77_006627 [Saxophila tyrrhenica]|uniref:Uncharacterized protein n=1 Tax=Saxophila tyrrhenica TaxID=1690608 RepID=A0AAV9P5C0_9PEZI|nr:hypothetical protein LTR77_006627 [Saxophila tyrrhenica]